jgi:hypothetical protein
MWEKEEKRIRVYRGYGYERGRGWRGGEEI